MRLNTLSPAPGSKKVAKRVGRGTGSGSGKTCGRGHKGQKARSGGFHKLGFEGGQMPIQRRLPKFGFNSHLARITAEIRLNELEKVKEDEVNIVSLRKAGIIGRNIKRAKVIASGEIKKAVKIVGLRATKGAREAIEKAGGSIEA